MIRRTALVTLFAATVAVSQQPANPPAPDMDNAPARGKVLFQRSQDKDQPTPKATAKRTPEKTIESITEAERSGATFTSRDLDVHIAPATSHIAVRASLTLRNTSKTPLTRIAMQFSSTMHWDTLSTGSKQVAFTEHSLPTDADHTGVATEALITLPLPLSPGDTLTLTGLYSGTIARSAERLTRIGAPPQQAASADWDRISTDVIALRGFGNVLWYPVCSPPLFLGDGAKLFQAIGASRQRESSMNFHLRLTVEYVGEPPVDAFLDGYREPMSHVTEEPNALVAESHGVATADFAPAPLDFRTPSLFVTWNPAKPSENQLLSVVTIRPEAIPPYAAAANDVAPLLREWLGPAPLTALTILDHPGQPYEDDAFVTLPLSATDATQITPAMVHSLAHAWFRSSLPWLNEGVPQLMSLLYSESTDGRDKALAELRSLINPLTLVEPENPADTATSGSGSPNPTKKSSAEETKGSAGTQTAPVGASSSDASTGFSSSSSSISSEPEDFGPPQPLAATLPPPPGQAGQSLIAAHDEVYYRAKAAAVLFMLRSITGDPAFKRALQLYRDEVRHADRSAPEDPHAFQRVLEATSHKDLSQIFDDWIYHDRGLADLSIASVTPRSLPARNGVGVSWLVAVEVKNEGHVGVDVPVTVRSGTLTTTERVHVPAQSSVSTRILFEGTPQEVQLNDGSIPETATTIHTRQVRLPLSTVP